MSTTRRRDGLDSRVLMYLLVAGYMGFAVGCEPSQAARPIVGTEYPVPLFLRVKSIWTDGDGFMMASLVIANSSEHPILLKIPSGGVPYDVRQTTLRPLPDMPNVYVGKRSTTACSEGGMIQCDRYVLLGKGKRPGNVSDTSSYCENIYLGTKDHLAKLGRSLRRQPPMVSVYLEYLRGAAAVRSADAAPIRDGQYQGIAIECDVPIDIYASELWKPGWRWEDWDIPCYPSSPLIQGCVLPPVP